MDTSYISSPFRVISRKYYHINLPLSILRKILFAGVKANGVYAKLKIGDEQMLLVPDAVENLICCAKTF
jgi:hypothetical protein